MNIECIDAQIVVTAESHNPTILNPDFLSMNKIVPKEWNWTTKEPIITTPAFSQVTYENDICIIVQPPSMRVVDPSCGDNPGTSKIPYIVRTFSQVLSHVKYTAVGTNFRVFLPMEKPEEYLKKTFVKKGPWCSGRHILMTAGLKFVYALPPSGRLLLELSSGTVTHKGESEKVGMVISSNFHRDSGKGGSTAEDVCMCIDKFADDWAMNQNLVKEILVFSERQK